MTLQAKGSHRLCWQVGIKRIIRCVLFALPLTIVPDSEINDNAAILMQRLPLGLIQPMQVLGQDIGHRTPCHRLQRTEIVRGRHVHKAVFQ